MILVFDLGTTYFKVVLVARDGRIRRAVRIIPEVTGSQSGWCELSAERFFSAIVSGACEVISPEGGVGQSVEAIVFATQGNSFILLDASERALTPVILWQDSRAKDLHPEIQRMAGKLELAEKTGVPNLTWEFMPAKLLWLSRNHPTLLNRTTKLCLLSDYLTLLLTGEHVIEAGVAALTGLMDVTTGQWLEQAAEEFSISPSWLPRIARAGTAVGPLLPNMADRLGVSRNCLFVVGCLDQYAGAIGVGNVSRGMVSETTGTVLAVVSRADRYESSDGTDIFQGPAERPTSFWRMAFGNISANYLHWYREQLADRPDFEELSQLAAEVPAGAGGLQLDRTRATPAEALAGLTGKYPRGVIARSIMEAVALALRDMVVRLGGSAEMFPKEIRSAGGGARSEVWLQIKSDVLGIPVRATRCQEPTSLGAAILAEAALTHGDPINIANEWVQLGPAYLPDEGNSAVYSTME